MYGPNCMVRWVLKDAVSSRERRLGISGGEQRREVPGFAFRQRAQKNTMTELGGSKRNSFDADWALRMRA